MQTFDGSAPGASIETEEVFSLRKGDWVAVCSRTRHASECAESWELRLFVGTPENELIAAYCDSPSNVSDVVERWKAKLLARGWS